MSSKYHSNDIDLVRPTQYNISKNKPAKKPPPKPWDLPKFEPLAIDDWWDHGEPNLPSNVNSGSPFELFSLFFTEEYMDKIVTWTNEFAELHRTPEEKQLKHRARPWKPTYRAELYAYLGILIHMGLHGEPMIEGYWKSLDPYGAEHKVKNVMGRERFEQLDRYFRVTKPWPDSENKGKSTFDRVKDLAEHLRLTCRRLYSPGTHLAVDETIERFLGRAFETVTIPTKPTPKGFKIWVLANEGYVLDWMWHARGNTQGPVDLDSSFLNEGFSKTQAVVLDFLTQRHPLTDLPLYPPHKHTVWLDNLFTSVKLCTRLRDLGIGCAGTVRTTKTQREEQGGEEGDIQVEETAAGQRKRKVPAEQFSRQLQELKLTHSYQIPWGELYGELSKDHTVMEFAWKDANVVLFMSTVHSGELITLTP
jgi:Transposase IS4